MDKVCLDMYVKQSPVNVFMNDVDPNMVLMMCSRTLPKNLLLFNPAGESPEFLRGWLEYRHVDPVEPLAKTTQANMVEKENTPPITGFYSFDVAAASTEFLMAWLSWFGVGSDTPQPRAWWEDLAREMQALRKDVPHAPPRERWAALVDSQKRLERLANVVVDSGRVLKRSHVRKPAEPKIKRKWTDLMKNLQIVSYFGNIEAKTALADALQASFILIPLLYDAKNKKWSAKVVAEHLSKQAPKQFKGMVARELTKYVFSGIDRGVLSELARQTARGDGLNWPLIGRHAISGIQNQKMRYLVELIVSPMLDVPTDIDTN